MGSTFHPIPEVYAITVYEDLKKTGVLEFAVIQSFDARILRALHHIDPSLKLVFLNEESSFEVSQLTTLLGFKPYGYSPYFVFVNEELVDWCESESIHLITWTVNEEKDIRTMLALGVKEIISDYPERVIQLLNGQ
jgi:glycerophosphoryl diester phosphodiesterase